MEPRIVIDVILNYNLIINNNCANENFIFYRRGTTRIMEKVNYSNLQQKQKGRTDAPQNKCGQSCRPCYKSKVHNMFLDLSSCVHNQTSLLKANDKLYLCYNTRICCDNKMNN